MKLRPRMIDPGIWKDSAIGRVTPYARLLYLATVTLSDDYGRFTADSVELKVQVFGYDPFTFDQVEEWLVELMSVGLILTYNAGGRRYGVHPKWLRYQDMDYRAKSQLPAPVGLDIDAELIEGAPGRVRKVPQYPGKSGTFSESPVLSRKVPESTLGEERRGEESTTPSISPPLGEDTHLEGQARRASRDRVEASPHCDYLVKLGRWFVALPHTITVAIDSPDWWRALDSCRTILDTQMAKVPSPDAITDPQDRLRRLLRFAVADTDFWQPQIRSLHGLAQKKPNGLPKWANIEVAATTPPTRSKAAGEARRAIPEASTVLADRPPAADPACGCDGGWEIDRDDDGKQVPCGRCGRGQYYAKKRRVA